jgi:hypothetical protein
MKPLLLIYKPPYFFFEGAFFVVFLTVFLVVFLTPQPFVPQAIMLHLLYLPYLFFYYIPFNPVFVKVFYLIPRFEMTSLNFPVAVRAAVTPAARFPPANPEGGYPALFI